ncbi:Sex-regulated protein janus-A [Vespula maculifrons]|uniref:Sex-regulated protein janus-A n=1 Tax=Vespula maculifrons TaxID=7453 RepID=A0ABD2B0B2_VESMC
MFSRAAKSVVKSFGQRKYYAGEDNLKIKLIGATEGVNLNASRLARQHSTLNTIPIYDVANTNKRFLFTQNRFHHFNEAEPFCGKNSQMLSLMEKSRSYEATSKQDSMMKESNNLAYLSDQLKVNETDINKLVEALQRLPIGEEAQAVNHLISPKLQSNTRSMNIKYEEPKYVEIERANALTIAGHQIRWSSSAKKEEDESNHSTGDRSINDDYFPEGTDYEDEYQSMRKGFSKAPPREEDVEKFVPTFLMSNNNATTEIDIGRVVNNIVVTNQDAFMAKNISDKTFEKLQTLVGKASELKKKMFRVKDKESVIETEVKDEHAKDYKIDDVEQTNNRSNNTNRRHVVPTMF